MASWYDIGDVGPDTDPEPGTEAGSFDDMHEQPQWWDGLLDDASNQREPGVGEAYNGEDPSIWSTQGDADEPDIQEDAVPPTFIQEWAEQENRQRALLRLRGIHIPDERTDVDPDTGEILTEDTDPILSWEESVAELQEVLAPIFPDKAESTPPVVPPVVPNSTVVEPPDDIQIIPDPVIEAVADPVQQEVPETLPEEAESLTPDDIIEIETTAERLLEDILDLYDSRDRNEFLVNQFNRDTISQLSNLVSAALNSEYPSVSQRNIDYFMRGVNNGLSITDPFFEFDPSAWDEQVLDMVLDRGARVDDTDNDIIDMTVASQLLDFSDVLGGVDQDTRLTEFNILGGIDDDDLL